MDVIFNKEQFTFHLQHKHSDTFANRVYEELSYPENQKMCDPILVTLLKMRPHDSQSIRENATLSSGTSPLASYKDVSLPPPPSGERSNAEVLNRTVSFSQAMIWNFSGWRLSGLELA